MHAAYSAHLIVIVCITLIFDENTLHQAPQHVIFFGLFIVVIFAQ